MREKIAYSLLSAGYVGIYAGVALALLGLGVDSVEIILAGAACWFAGALVGIVSLGIVSFGVGSE